MRYLTPELLARYRSSDDAVAEVAAGQWDQAAADYNAELQAIRPFLPAGVRALLTHYALHDARILGITEARRRPRFSLLVQLEGIPARPGKALELRYLLARNAKDPGFSLLNHGGPENGSQVRGRIQYDEFSKVADEPGVVFSHSLLLQGGYELQIRFTELHVRQLQRVILPSVEHIGPAMA
jgi:hypothetical protein